MDVAAELELAREAHRRQAWADAYDRFIAVDRVAPLDTADLELAAEAADMLGRGDDAIELLRRAYEVYATVGEVGSAVRCAFWLQQALAFKGDAAHAAGWIARAERLVEAEPECPERGYVLLKAAERFLGDRDFETAFATAGRAVELGNRCGDRDLVNFAVRLQAWTRLREGRAEEGLALFDEAMVAVTAGETSARVISDTYCSVIHACHELGELRRAREWTLALNAWCDAHPQATGGYSGICRVHRSELLQLGGAWPDAVREARLACEQLTRGYGEVVAGAAFYQLAEIHRLRGEPADAEEAYRRASQYGWSTQPGLALLRLAQGRPDVALAGIRRALAETAETLARSHLLPAYVEILLAAEDVTGAREGATELAAIAESYDTPALLARAAHARGAVHLADGNPEASLPALRLAWQSWRDLDAPYEAARVRVLVGQACRGLNDEDTAAMEFDAARQVFDQLGAGPDLTQVDALTRKRPVGEATGLTPREVEVLRLIAAGKTNQAIATDLFLSEKTVHRHVSNIFTKLGVGSRTAAAVYASEHGLTTRGL